jgi:hypothetical protein
MQDAALGLQQLRGPLSVRRRTCATDDASPWSRRQPRLMAAGGRGEWPTFAHLPQYQMSQASQAIQKSSGLRRGGELVAARADMPRHSGVNRPAGAHRYSLLQPGHMSLPSSSSSSSSS